MRRTAVLVSIGLLLSVSAYADGHSQQRGVTSRLDGVGLRATDLGKRATPIPPARTSPVPLPTPSPPLLPDTIWMVIDSLLIQRLVPAGERLAVCFDFGSRNLRDTLLADPLTPRGREAVGVAPDWLKPDLADNLRRMDISYQDLYANLILLCPDKRYYDELCFQIAHLSPQTLTWYDFDPELLIENVQLAYQVDPELQYVDILDYGDPVHGGDYYSTTIYWTVEAGDTQLVEIPREIYYWWVISPKLSDELPRMDGSVYNYFWREYLYYFADSGYPLLRDYLPSIRVLWDGNLHTLPSGRPFTDTTFALDVIANWVTYTVPSPASGNRPIQPNQIAHEHNGNCGELQDLLSAAARTGLIPAVCTCDINEDHVWVAFWWEGDWHPYQVDLGFGSSHIDDPRVAYDREHGGGKEVSGIWNWRGDGFQWSDVSRYSDCCTLTVLVEDTDGDPVDGAIVKLSSEMWPDGKDINPCFYGATDRQGEFTTTLGDSQNYYLAIESDLGNYSPGMIIDSACASPGVHLYFDHNLPGQMYHVPAIPDTDPPPPEDWFRLEVSYSVPRETVYGYDCYNRYFDNWYAQKHYSGGIDFFIADQSNFQDYLQGNSFYAYQIREDLAGDSVSFVLPTNENYYLTFSNEEQLSLTELAQVRVYLYENQLYTGVAQHVPYPTRNRTTLTAHPNPFSHATIITYHPPARRGDEETRGGGEGSTIQDPGSHINLSVFDLSGRLIRTLLSYPSNYPSIQLSHQAVWDGKDGLGHQVGSGVYLLRATASGSQPETSLTRKLVLIR